MNDTFHYKQLKKKISDNNHEIYDYSESDFRLFWKKYCNQIMHPIEETLIKDNLSQADGWFLDLGCGFGRLLPAYYHRAAQFVLVDYSLKNLQAASGLYQGDNIYFIAADLYSLPFKKSVFNRCVCIRVFHHINHPHDFFKEFAHLCAPKAEVIVNYMNLNNFLRLLRYGCYHAAGHSWVSRGVYGTHPDFFRHLASHYGFSSRKIGGVGFLHQVDNNIKCFNALLNKRRYLTKMFAAIEHVFDYILGKLELSFLQFVRLKKNTKNIVESGNECKVFSNILVCPACRCKKIIENPGSFFCSTCKRIYKKYGRIIDFRL